MLFHTVLTGVETDGHGHVTAVLVASKRGLTALSARVYVDGTGDADLSVWAGADFEKGGADGALQPATLCFLLSHVNTYAYAHKEKPRTPAIRSVIESGKYPRLQWAEGTASFKAGWLFLHFLVDLFYIHA